MSVESQQQVGGGSDKGRTHEIRFTVDGEPYETVERELTPNQILTRFAEKDPANHYLVQIQGQQRISYEGKGDEPIKLHNNLKFQVISTGPTPVSDPGMRTGVDVFAAGLAALGYNPVSLPGNRDHVVIDYDVESGRFTGRKVKHGFIVPADFPMTAPSGPHVSPHIHPIKPDGSPHPTGAVHQSQAAPFQQALGGEWQYWSRPCPDWATSKKTVAAYMSHIWRLWNSQ